MKVKVIPEIFGKGIGKVEIGRRAETFETLLRSARILRRVLET